ncbi:MAG: LysR family transcriptional regulator [Acidobacteriota bacterium]|nr:LysR family transcriptional regulator [Acidobacteriota bacterium]
MEVRQLQIFTVLAEELNFTRTAERVHTVQSNVTSQIKALEQELGVPLFDRLGRRVALTDAGKRFLPFAEKALESMEHGLRALQNGAEPSGPLRIGAPESVVTYRLPRVLSAFRKKYPRVEVIFRPDTPEPILADLESGKVDLAIYMKDEITHPSIIYQTIRTERIFLLSHPGHPLTKKRTVKPSDLGGQTLLLTEHGCAYRAKLDRALAMQNVKPGHITEFNSVEAIKKCVAAGLGLAILPAIVVSGELRAQQMKALHWAGPQLDIATHILWHRDKWVSPAMKAFCDLVMESLERDDTRDAA